MTKPRKGLNLFKEALYHMPLCQSKASHPLTAGTKHDWAWSIDGALSRAAHRLISNPQHADNYARKFRRHVQRCLNHGKTLAGCGSHIRYTAMSQWLEDCHKPYRDWQRESTQTEIVRAVRNHSFDWLCHLADQWEQRKILHGGNK